MNNFNDENNYIDCSSCSAFTKNCTIKVLGNNILSPLLTKRIIGCLEYSLSNIDLIENMNFNLTDLGVTYPNGGKVCVDNIIYSYDNIGLINNPINARISCNSISLFPVNGYNTFEQDLYDEYLGVTNLACCDCVENIKIVEQSLEFYISNLIVTAQGTIGGQPFIGTYTYSGTLV